MNGEFPPIAELLPQAGPMRLLECVLAHDAEETRCAVRPSRSALFRDAEGNVPVWVAIEYMAQCAAADGSLRLRAPDSPALAPRPGLFIGSRRLVFRCAGFDAARRLVVTARRAAGREGGLLAFDCAVLDAGGGAPLAEGRLNVLPGQAGLQGQRGGAERRLDGPLRRE